MKPLLSLILTACTFMGAAANATITLVGVSGASKVDTSTNPTIPILYGGLAGSETAGECSSRDGVNTCDNCTSALAACHPNRIYPSLQLVISFKSDSEAGTPLILTGKDETIANVTSSGTVQTGQTGYVAMDWSDLCNALDSASCATNISSSIKVGIAADGSTTEFQGSPLSITVVANAPSETSADEIEICGSTAATDNGVCTFLAYPGDEKVYIEDTEKTGDFPSASGTQFTHVRILYSTTGFSDANPDACPENCVDIAVEEDADEFFLSDNAVKNLENGITYFFRLGLVDKAGNIGFFTAANAINGIAGCASEDDENCQFMATPDEVYGLLTDDLNCFISTAAYGSNSVHQVQTFREFRNQILLPYSFGKAFIGLYYKYGPYAAHWMAHSPWKRTMARAALWPAWVFAKGSLKFGFLPMLFVLFVTLITATGFCYKRYLQGRISNAA